MDSKTMWEHMRQQMRWNNNVPEVLKLAVYVAAAEEPEMERMVYLHQRTTDLQRELGRMEIHDRIWDSEAYHQTKAELDSIELELKEGYRWIISDVWHRLVWITDIAEA